MENLKAMEFYPIHKKQEELFTEIRQRIFRLQNGRGLDSMQRIGANTQGQIGASYPSLKTLAKNYQPDLELALRLWGTQKREEQIMACFLLPASSLIKEKITQLLSSCFNFEIAEYFGTLVLATREDIKDIVTEYLYIQNSYFQIAALTAIAKERMQQRTNTKFSADYIRQLKKHPWHDKYTENVYNRLIINAGIDI